MRQNTDIKAHTKQNLKSTNDYSPTSPVPVLTLRCGLQAPGLSARDPPCCTPPPPAAHSDLPEAWPPFGLSLDLSPLTNKALTHKSAWESSCVPLHMSTSLSQRVCAWLLIFLSGESQIHQPHFGVLTQRKPKC